MAGMLGVPSVDAISPWNSPVYWLASPSGSNAVVVHGSRSSSGAPLFAADPHLGIFAPNIWLIVGWSTPEYRVTGLSFPGLPFIGIGRNEHLAWGGTNMRSWSSDLYQLNEQQVAAATIEEAIDVRWWFDTSVQRRVTP